MLTANSVKVIPRPAKIVMRDGTWRCPAQAGIFVAPDFPEARNGVELLRRSGRRLAGVEFPTSTGSDDRQKPVFVFAKPRDHDLPDEAYRLEIDLQQVKITSTTSAGAFYAVQTFLQLLPPESLKAGTAANPWKCPCLEIEDWPRFRWRGAHLDVSRHFFAKEDVFRYLDILAFHKINTFHFHLTDDQGWRIQIIRYPKLTEVGAWRVNHEEQDWNHRDDPREGEVADYGGFYTQQDLREIVQYAAERCIQVVPEIEMPGHTMAALAAYPELSCTGGPFHVPPGQYWPITNLLCAGNEQTFEFLEGVLQEVCDIFPAPFVHIGGDEADPTEWARCPKCRQRMKEQQLESAALLQGYFMNRVGRMLQKFGKRPIGWDEILDSGLDSQTVVMSWRGVEGGISAARQQHDVVMCPVTHCYFDHYQNDPQREPKAFGGNTPLCKVYAFEPVPANLSAAEKHRIWGAQANLWTEYIPFNSHLEYMLLPRLAALSEVLWLDSAQRNWTRFSGELPELFQRYRHLDWNFAGEYQ